MKNKVVGFFICIAVALPMLLVSCKKPQNTDCKHLDYSTVVVTENSCLGTGKEKDICNSCGETIAVRSTSALGHNFTEWQQNSNSSCSEYGVSSRSCQNGCGKTEYSYSQKLKHTAGSDGICTICNEKAFSVGLNYQLSDDESYYIVSIGSANDSNIIIPAYHNDLPVKKIANDGFAYANWVTCITVPETITELGDGAFNSSNNLEIVYFNAVSCNDLGERNWVFLRAESQGSTAKPLSVIFGKAVKRIPSRLFFPLYSEPDKVTYLNSVTFEENSVLESIGEYAFYKTNLTTISLPKLLVEIGDNAFTDSKLTTISLGGVQRIGKSVFSGSQDLVSVDFGSSLNDIGDNAFDYCTKLQNADLSKINGNIGENVFKNCTSLATVDFSDDITSIPKRAFYNCSALTKVELGYNTLSIGEESFANCVALTEITVGENITTILDKAFLGCVNVDTLNFNAINCGDLAKGNQVFKALGFATGGVSVTFGEFVEYIPSRLLYTSADVTTLPNVSSVTINKSVQTVGDYAFFGIDAPVTFIGSRSLWNKVSVGENNDCLLNISFGG